MYLHHFGLREYPFGLTPDTSFFFDSVSSQQALNTLLVATREREGFIKVVGEVGSGKTMLCRQLLRSLGPEFQTAFVPNPYLSPRALLADVAEDLGADPRLVGGPHARKMHVLIRVLRYQLLALAQQGKQALLCLDEAQAMPTRTLEMLRLITNLETEKRKLLQVVIFGQPELDKRLAHPAIRQLRQRITFEHRLTPMSSQEVARYVAHRLAAAGHGGPLFSTSALWMLRWHTRGYPRLVNIAAHKALFSAFGRGSATVGVRDVHAAVQDTAALHKRWPRLPMAGLATATACFFALHATACT